MSFTNNDIRQFVNDLAKKDRQGALRFPQFNRFLKAANRNHFDYHWKFYEKNQKSTDTLAPFKKIKQGTLSQSGSVADDLSLDMDAYVLLPDDYAHLVPGSIKTDGGYPVEKVTEAEWYERLSQIIKKPTTKNPICVFGDGYLRIAPTTIDSVEFSYLRYPAEPYLDGYILNSNNEFVYLEAGGSVDLNSTSGEALDGTSSGTYNSQTVELEWNLEDKLEIAARIAAMYGLSVDKVSLFEYSGMMKREDQ
jgi:hypothetical protein